MRSKRDCGLEYIDWSDRMRKRVMAGILILCMCLTGCNQSSESTETDIDSIELKSNQEIVIGKITQIAGNEVTYTIAEKADASAIKQQGERKDSEKESSERNMPEMPQSSPDGKAMQEPPDGGGDESDASQKQPEEASVDKEQQVMYTLTDDSETKLIPVGTEVITSLGSKTTFSRLSNGDLIKMLMETDSDGNQVIVGIWMV